MRGPTYAMPLPPCVAAAFMAFSCSVIAGPTYPIGFGDESLLPGASEDCLAAFNTNVTCVPIVGDLFDDPYMALNKSDLDGLCTTACYQSITTLRDAIDTKCGNTSFDDPADGTQRKPTFLAEWALMAYNLTCLKNSDGKYCNVWYLEDAAKADNPDCDECYLKLPYIEAQSPAAGDSDEAKSIYESLSASCTYNGPSITKTVTNLVISSPTGKTDCDFKYEIKKGDTYLGVSLSQNVSTHDLVTSNGLNYSLKNFPSSGTLCIRHQCNVYVVKDGDTCSSILSSTDVNEAELRSWNPDINGLCNNVHDKVNQTICVSNPRGDYTVPSNGPGTSPAPVPDNLAPNTTTNCSIYHEVQGGEDCSRLETKYSISLKDFIFLNPMVWENCTNLWVNTTYCVSPVGNIKDYPGYSPPAPSYEFCPGDTDQVPFKDPLASWKKHKSVIPIANKTRTDCWQYGWWNNTNVSLPSVADVAWLYNVNMDLFLEWNPDLSKDGGMKPSASYCVSLGKPRHTTWVPPSPRALDEDKNCSAWFAAGSDCKSQLKLLRLDLQDFFKWNPSVGEDCSSYVSGTYYCRGVSTQTEGDDGNESTTALTKSTTPTSPPVPSTKTSHSQTAAPTQTSQVNISPDGTCAGKDSYTCKGSQFGDCCSSSNYCGSTSGFCGGGCQPKFGTCDEGSDKISPDGTCGGDKGYTCEGSAFGSCCSQYGYCGKAADNCGGGCQKTYGTCG